MKLYTIGFTKKPARVFFGLLRDAGARSLVDVRLNNVSQLAGFAKQDDLRFFLGRIAGIGYSVEALLAPTGDILDAYRKKELGWDEYARRYLALLDARKVEHRIAPGDLADACLLCSEATPDHCHRRLAADYLALSMTGVEIVHL